jgi:hypothetical protein
MLYDFVFSTKPRPDGSDKTLMLVGCESLQL